MEPGEVYIVGAGPGDPGLITIGALESLKEADVVYYDYLASAEILEMINDRAEKICISKVFGKQVSSQEELNRALVNEGKKGRKVVRLKGGDPFIFGRGGEEAEALAEAGVPFRIIPGITSGTAAAAYAGIPTTHRDYASCLTLITGHESRGKESRLDYAALAQTGGTLIFYMGRERLCEIAGELVMNGLPENTPVAVIRWGTRGDQETVTGTLENIASVVDDKGFTPPVITVIGNAVNLRDKLNWFEKLPLFGKTILITGTRKRVGRFRKSLTGKGAQVRVLPLIEIEEPDDYAPFDNALKNLEQYDWLVFTSANGVEMFMDRLYSKGLDVRVFSGIKIASIGEATSDSIRAYHLIPDLTADTFTSEGLLEKILESFDPSGMRFLLARAKEASPVLSSGLKNHGAYIEEITVYKTRLMTEQKERLREWLRGGEIDIITFASSSAVEAFSQMPGPSGRELVENVRMVSIGPVTTETMRGHGYEPAIQAEPHSVPGLVEACVEVVKGETVP